MKEKSKKKRLIIDSIFIVLVLILISVISFFVLSAFKIVSFEDGIKFNAKIF